MPLQLSCEQVVCTPPETEECAEEQRGAQTMVHALDPVASVYLLQTVDWPRVEARRLVCCILNLETGLDVLDRRSNKRHCPARHCARHGMAVCGKPALRFAQSGVRGWIEDPIVEDAAVYTERAQHASRCQHSLKPELERVLHRVHEHPSYQRRSGALVQSCEALFPQRLHETIYRASEMRSLRRLQTHFYRVEWVADCVELDRAHSKRRPASSPYLKALRCR